MTASRSSFGFAQDDPEELEGVIETERLILCALCQGTREGSVREVARETLRQYRWREPLHATLFETIMSMPTESTAALREQLPSRLTRRGFPDVAWEDFFEPHSLSKQEVERMISKLALA